MPVAANREHVRRGPRQARATPASAVHRGSAGCRHCANPVAPYRGRRGPAAGRTLLPVRAPAGPHDARHQRPRGRGRGFLLGLPVLVGTYLDQPCGLRLLCDESDPGTDSRADQCGTSPLHKSVATMGRRATPASGRIAPIEIGPVSHGAAEGSHLAAASVRLPQEQHLPFPCEVVALFGPSRQNECAAVTTPFCR